jgi:hypothetical protein
LIIWSSVAAVVEVDIMVVAVLVDFALVLDT